MSSEISATWWRFQKEIDSALVATPLARCCGCLFDRSRVILVQGLEVHAAFLEQGPFGKQVAAVEAVVESRVWIDEGEGVGGSVPAPRVLPWSAHLRPSKGRGAAILHRPSDVPSWAVLARVAPAHLRLLAQVLEPTLVLLVGAGVVV